MTADPFRPEPPRLAEFVVRPDGSVRGDDGAAGVLAAALPYVCRLARRVGELVDAGDLRRIETAGDVRLSVGITWTPTGEGTYRALVTEEATRTPPHFMVVGGADTAATVEHCVRRVAGVAGVAWSTIMGPESRTIAVAGEQALEAGHLPEVGTRVLALLRELAAHQVTYVRLQFEAGAVLGAMIGRHCLFALAEGGDGSDDPFLAVVDEVRAILADHDLAEIPAGVPTAGAGDDASDVAPAPAVARTPRPVGARYRGASSAGPRANRGSKDATPRRRPFGR